MSDLVGVNALDETQPKRGAESARRVLALLMAFSATRHTLSARELAELTGIPLASVYRYVAILREEGLLVGDDQGGYHPSARFLPLAQAVEAATSLVDIAAPVMRRLAEATGETVILVRLVGGHAVCVHRVESAHHLRTSYQPGQPMPLEHGASARILLASMPDADRHRYLADLATRDPERAALLAEEVVIVGERGWESSEEEIDRGVWAAAAAIRDNRRILASLSVPSPLVRAPVEVRGKLLDQVRAAAEEINAVLRDVSR
jgi:DNA-binding IclR family transcriptional regulator